MKTLKIYLVTILANTWLVAQDLPSISAVMAKLENGLSNIQKGFLYNNKKLIELGVDEVQKENLIYHEPKVVKDMLPANKKQMKNAAMLTSYRIENASKELKEYLKLNQMRNAHGAFSDIVKACTDCHVITRGW